MMRSIASVATGVMLVLALSATTTGQPRTTQTNQFVAPRPLANKFVVISYALKSSASEAESIVGAERVKIFVFYISSAGKIFERSWTDVAGTIPRIEELGLYVTRRPALEVRNVHFKDNTLTVVPKPNPSRAESRMEVTFDASFSTCTVSIELEKKRDGEDSASASITGGTCSVRDERLASLTPMPRVSCAGNFDPNALLVKDTRSS